MKRTESDGQYSPEETEQRLRKLMRGAFAGPPTQMKDIPKKRKRGVGASPIKPKKSA
jgi:hypothetical protein